MELNEPHGPADADLLAHLDTEERRKIEARVQKRLDYVGGLRALANAINDDPDLPLPGDLTAHRGFYGPDALDIIRAATRSLGSIEKKGNEFSFIIERDFGGGVKLQYTTTREATCTKRVTGKRTVEKEIYPNVEPVRTLVEEDIVEWDCPSLLSDEPAEAAPTTGRTPIEAFENEGGAV